MARWLLGLLLLVSAQPAEVKVRACGAIPDDGKDDTAAIQRAINNSRPGQTVSFEPGVYEISRELMLRSRRTYAGNNTTLKSLGTEFAARIEAGATDVRITGFRFENAGIFLGEGGTYFDIFISDNVFADMDGNAIKITSDSDQVSIERNRFERISGYGVIETYNTSRLSFRFNRLMDCAHGGHFLGPKEDNNISFNHMSGLRLMGLEIQSLGPSVSTDLTVEGNVIHDWRSTNSQSMGLSVPCEHGQNTRIVNNYVNGNLAAGQNWIEAEGRKPAIGTMIEVGGETIEISGNVIGGTWWFCIGAGGVHQPPRFTNLIENNTFFGKSIASQPLIAPWPNSIGKASWSEGRGNQIEPDAAKMPPPDEFLARIGKARKREGAR